MPFSIFSNRVISFFHNLQQNIFGKKEQSYDYRDMILKGQNLLRNKKYSHAVSIFKKCIRLFPDKPGGYHGMSAYSQQTWQRDKAVFWLNRCIEKTDDVSGYKTKARFLVVHGHYDEGIGIVDEVLKKFGHSEQNLIFKARLLFIPKRYSEAAKILKGMQHNVESQSLLARALIGGDEFEEANEIIDTLEQWPVQLKEEVKILNLLKCWQKNYQKGAGYELPKIFGIGLSRTGTTSLTEALNILGYGAIHFKNPMTSQIINDMDYRFFDAFTDSPVSYRFENLYSLFPNAKFIYTERSLEDWVYSSSRLYKPWGVKTTTEFKSWLDPNRKGKFVKVYHNYDPVYQKAYRSLYADFPDWKTAYLAFEERVQQFFAGKPHDILLKMNICKQPEWDALCNFLGVDVPDVPFPDTNKMNW
ncbi:MAG TPA: sulfotransferase [Saprospiraceae bacterium]|nr:sulfotransferase [Saprospiraceae bacterium]